MSGTGLHRLVLHVINLECKHASARWSETHQALLFSLSVFPNSPDGPGERRCSHTAVPRLGVNGEFAMENLSEQGPDGRGDMLFISLPVRDPSQHAVRKGLGWGEFIFLEGTGLKVGLYIAEKVVYSHLSSKRLVSLTTVYALKISVVHLYRPAGMLRCKR